MKERKKQQEASKAINKSYTIEMTVTKNGKCLCEKKTESV